MRRPSMLMLPETWAQDETISLRAEKSELLRLQGSGDTLLEHSICKPRDDCVCRYYLDLG